MKETKIYCGHCGKELDDMKDYISITVELSHNYEDIDLCKYCFDELWNLIKKYSNKD